MEPWGGMIETPNINKLAENGLTYTNWHTTALCSPTRSSLLTGRNHTTNGMAWIAEATTGFPNSNGHIPFECATIAEVLGERGWNTYMLGKWHLVAADEMNMGFTNATAFSPTDTMPLVPWAKIAMAVQAFVSLAILGLVIARAVNLFA